MLLSSKFYTTKMISSGTMDLTSLMAATCEVAKKAGYFIRQERASFDWSKIEHKGFNDLVSYVDKEAEKILVAGLGNLLPEADFITEEGTAGRNNKVYTWIIDPLDGTTNFIHGLPVFAVSIGLRKDDEIVLGVVYEVNADECFYAAKGLGAFCNGKPIHVSKASSLSQSLIATGFPYSAFQKIDDYLLALKTLMQQTHGLRRMGSAAIDLCYVACGRMDGYFEYNLQPYDVAGGSIIVKEAGGQVTDFRNGEDYIFGREILATNGLIHDEFYGLLRSIWG